MSTTSNYNIKHTTYWLCITAMFMALNIVMSSFSIPVPGGHLYMNDIVICTAAILLNPFAAFMVGGVGAFLGDLFFYPTPNVRLTGDPWSASYRDLTVFSPYYEKAPGTFLRNRSGNWCCYHDRGILSWQSIYLQHTGICNIEATLPDIAGRCRGCCGNDPMLELQAGKII